MSEKRDEPEDRVVSWAREISKRFEGTENELHPHFQKLLNEYRRLLRSFKRVTRISDGYQQTLIENNEYLNQVARRDALTGMSNRRDMMARLSNELKRSVRYEYPVSVILIDIDHFKKVNDTYGHGVGDQVLVALAQLLNNGIRDTDSAARWGGEEFLICLPHTSCGDAKKVAEKLRSTVEENWIIQKENRIGITISAGVAQYERTSSMDDLICLADNALYQAKEAGRNRVASAE
jgi:diguanylate cyclase (GGDEF)-like protein